MTVKKKSKIKEILQQAEKKYQSPRHTQRVQRSKHPKEPKEPKRSKRDIRSNRNKHMNEDM